MELREGIKLNGRPAEIPDCSRDDLPTFFKERGFKVGVEVGIFMGEYTEKLAQSGLKIYGVDPWIPYRDYGYINEEWRHEKLYRVAKKRLGKYPNVTILRKTSMQALDDFKDESIDFVYIDANHRFKYVAEDLMEWSRKVKTGGVIAGHDYALFKHRYPGCGCQVREVIDAYARSFEFDFWVLGRYRAIPGEKRDRMRSWLFIKNWKNV